MSTSGTYNFAVTLTDIIRQAMLNIGKLDEDEAPTATQTQDCSRVLNMLVKQWMGKADFAPGLKMWTRRRGHLFLSSTTGRYSLGATSTGWTESYVQTTTTTTAAGGATAVVLSSVSGVASGYNIGIQLDSGALFWTTVSSVVSLTANIGSALPSQSSSGSVVFVYQTAAQQPIVVETAILRDINSNDTPLRIMNTQDYDFLPSKANVTSMMDPTAVYYEFQLTNSYLYTDSAAAQDVTKHIVLTYQEPVQDITNPTDNPEFPQEWYLPLCWGLAMQIAPMFNAPWTSNMQMAYQTALAVAQKKDPETTSLYFMPGDFS